jgi:8-oxo-dGTP pyrophosphatase MutT (NUDIX family)
MKKEFTASVYIIEDQKILLIYHRKLGKWLPAGGHVEENEMPPETALREALEETGWEIELIPQENLWVNYWNARSFERPYLCLLEDIPAYQHHPAHQHVDFVYVARPLRLIDTQIPQEQMHWFTWEEIEQLEPDVAIFKETLQVIRHLFDHFVCPNPIIKN